MSVRIKDLDGITYDVDEDNANSYVISIGNDNIVIPFPEKINDEDVYDFVVVDCSLTKIMRDEANPKSEGGYSGTVTIRYYVDAQVPFFMLSDDPAFLAQHPDMMNEGVKNYYEIPYLVQYVPLDGVYDVFFNNTMQSIYELMDKVYEEENKNGKA